MRRQESLERLEGVLREYRAARFCVDEAADAIDRGNMLLIPKDSQFRPRDVTRCRDRLEATFILRIFAHFEGTVREYWQHVRRKPTRMAAEHLIDRVGAKRNVLPVTIKGAHDVREIRNQISHESKTLTLISIVECKSRLAKFVSFLPEDW